MHACFLKYYKYLHMKYIYHYYLCKHDLHLNIEFGYMSKSCHSRQKIQKYVNKHNNKSLSMFFISILNISLTNIHHYQSLLNLVRL